MEILVWVFFVVFGLLLQAFFLLALPSFLAIKTVKVLLPPVLSEESDSQFSPRRLWCDMALMLLTLIPLTLLLRHFGVDIFLKIPTWAPWVPEDLHHMYHRIPFTMPIATFIAKILSVLYFGRRCQKDNGPIK